MVPQVEARFSGLFQRTPINRTALAQGKSAAAATAAAIQLPATLSECACLVLRTAEPDLKAALSHRIWDTHKLAPLPLTRASAAQPPDAPSRPPKPELLPPKLIPTQKQSPFSLNVYQ